METRKNRENDVEYRLHFTGLHCKIYVYVQETVTVSPSDFTEYTVDSGWLWSSLSVFFSFVPRSFLPHSGHARSSQRVQRTWLICQILIFSAPMLLPAATVADARSIGDGDGQVLSSPFWGRKNWVMCDLTTLYPVDLRMILHPHPIPARAKRRKKRKKRRSVAGEDTELPRAR